MKKRKINHDFVKFNENDVATRQEEIADGHRKYTEHIANVRRQLGLDDDPDTLRDVVTVTNE